MKKNCQLHLFLETELLDQLKKQANEENISVSELCRKKLTESSKINRIEFMLEQISRRLNKK